MRLYTQDEKNGRIKAEVARLRRFLRQVEPERLKVAEGLINEVAFMRATLEETREIIDRDGILDLFEQGKQRILREHPATKVYSVLVARYASLYKQLLDLVPDKVDNSGTDELKAFLTRQK